MAKNFDWPDDKGYIFFNDTGIKKYSINDPLLVWKSKYKSITLNQFGKEFPLAGINETGLVIEELNMPYISAKEDTSKFQINEFQLVQYILDTCDTIEEVIEKLKMIRLNPILFSLHYIVTDNKGKCIIIEFNESSFDIYDTSVSGFPLLSNNTYAESLRYLKKFQGFGGDIPVKNRPGSNERFVTMANMLKKSSKPSVNYSFEILDSVKQEDTRWSVVYDISNLTLYMRYHSCVQSKKLYLKDIFTNQILFTTGCNINNFCCRNSEFRPVTKEENSQLIDMVVNQLINEIETPEKLKSIKELKAFSNKYVSNIKTKF